MTATDQASAPSAAVRRAGIALSISGWLAIAVATVTPATGGNATLPFGCVVCGPDGGIDAAANLVLFIPLGLGLALTGLRPRRALVCIALTTLTVELLQLRFVTGRDTSLGDLVWNGVGGAVGLLLERRWRGLIRPAPRVAAAMAAGWAALWMIGTAVTAWSFRPLLSGATWVSHVGAPLAATGPRPAVLDARVGDLRLRTRTLANKDLVRAHLLGGAPLVAEAVVPNSGRGPVNIVVLDDGNSQQVMTSLQRVGDGAAYYTRTRAASLRLRSPTFVIGGIFASDLDTVRLQGARVGSVVQVEGAGPQLTVRRSVSMSPNWGWSLLLPPGLSAVDRMHWYTVLWVAALVAPIGYWAAHALSRRSRSAVAALAALAALMTPAFAFVIIPPVAGLAAVHWSEWAAWAGATALALTAGRVVRGRAAAAPAAAAGPAWRGARFAS